MRIHFTNGRRTKELRADLDMEWTGTLTFPQEHGISPP